MSESSKRVLKAQRLQRLTYKIFKDSFPNEYVKCKNRAREILGENKINWFEDKDSD